MKNLTPKLLLVASFLFFSIYYTLSADIKFKATIKNTENASLSGVYIKFYLPGQDKAVDSMFTDSQGVIERSLTFVNPSSITDLKIENSIIVRKLSPNILFQNGTDCSIEYNYTEKPQLFFIDLYGRSFPNNSELTPGIYFYYLQFGNGVKSEKNRLAVIEKCFVNVNLIPTSRVENLKSGTINQTAHDKFYAVFIKDGYITKHDTILINSNNIIKSYSLVAASKPTANFNFSGNLKVGKPVIFDGLGSYGANNEPLVYSWDFGDGKRGQSSGIPHIYNSPGNYTVTLTVAGDYQALHSVSKTVTISADVTPASYSGSIKGYITDSNFNNLSDVIVSLLEGTTSSTTDNSGMVSLSNLPVGVPLHFKVLKTGYATQIVSLTIPNDTKKGIFFSVLKNRNASIILSNAEFGGKVSGSDGASLILPVAGLLKPDGSVVTGNVNVFVTPVNVSSDAASFPGSFNAFRNNGEGGVLLSYGVSEYQFQQDGKTLQLAPGKTASIQIPIYTSEAGIGDKILLWSVNEDNGIWVEEGIGTVVYSEDSPTRLALKAEVGHLSWWNCDEFEDPQDRDVLCWRWECTSGQCFREKVGCWMSGAMHDDGTPARAVALPEKNLTKSIKLDGVAVPPVFEVREYVSQNGYKLKFPKSRDVYLAATGINNSGELLKGDTLIKAGTNDTIKVELKLSSTKDSIVIIPLNKTLGYYLKKGGLFRFGVNLPQKNAYRVNLKCGEIPKLYGSFVIYDKRGELNMGSINYGPRYVVSDSCRLFVTVSGQDVNSEGNFTIEVSEPAMISIKDSVSASFIAPDYLRFYSLKPKQSSILMAQFYNNENVSSSSQIKFYPDPKVPSDYDYISNKKGLISYPVFKDSVYFFELKNNTGGSFVLTTQEDTLVPILYGDTINGMLKYKEDINLYYFTGKKDDLVSVKCNKPNYELLNGEFELWDPDGKRISKKAIEHYSLTNKDQEIICKLPKDGKYSIVISSKTDDDGSYQLILTHPKLNLLNINSLTKWNVKSDSIYYFQFEIPSKKMIHFSIISENDTKNGVFNITDEKYVRLTENNQFFNNKVYGFRPFTDTLSPGKYFIEVINGDAKVLNLNLTEAKLLSLNAKGKAQFNDTLKLNKANAYAFYGSKGDGFSSVLRRIDKTKVPDNLKLFTFPLGDKDYLNIQGNYSFNSGSLDSSYLFESASTFKGDPNTIWVITVLAESTGVYEYNFYRVKSSDSIVVDDDFLQYPGAHTSSLTAAGFAVKENGKILIANGDYTSYYPVTIDVKKVTISGQEKGNVKINHINDHYYALLFESSGGTIRNLTLRNGPSYERTVYLGGNDIVLENVDLCPLPGKSKIGGGVRGGGKNLIVRNVSATSMINGFNVNMENGIIEKCTLTSDFLAIQGAGPNAIIRNNTLVVNNTSSAIYAIGNCLVDSNKITIKSAHGSTNGVINMEDNGLSGKISTIRYNTIVSAGSSCAFSASIGGGSASKIIAEHNTYKSTNALGSMALYISGTKVNGSSGIIIRNNIFDGLKSNEAVWLSYVDNVADGQRFALYNNNFRTAPGTNHNVNNNFVLISTYNSSFTDSANLFIVNNIFQGDGHASFIKCDKKITFYNDFNVIYNFSKLVVGLGNPIGSYINSNPKYAGDNLRIESSSPAIDKGASPLQYPLVPEVDIERTARPQGSGYDIGAYER